MFYELRERGAAPAEEGLGDGACGHRWLFFLTRKRENEAEILSRTLLGKLYSDTMPGRRQPSVPLDDSGLTATEWKEKRGRSWLNWHPAHSNKGNGKIPHEDSGSFTGIPAAQKRGKVEKQWSVSSVFIQTDPLRNPFVGTEKNSGVMYRNEGEKLMDPWPSFLSRGHLSHGRTAEGWVNTKLNQGAGIWHTGERREQSEGTLWARQFYQKDTNRSPEQKFCKLAWGKNGAVVRFPAPEKSRQDIGTRAPVL